MPRVAGSISIAGKVSAFGPPFLQPARSAGDARGQDLEEVSCAGSGNDPAGLSGTLVTLLSNRDLVRSAGEKAAMLGYEVIVDNGCDDWPYDKAAVYLVDRLVASRQQHPGRKLCLLSGGEVTVRIDRKAGSGGRNQHFALSCSLLLRQELPN